MNRLKDTLKQHHKTINILFFLLGAIIIVYVTNNLFVVFAPLIIAYLVTQIFRPLCLFLHTKIKIPNSICALICILIFIIVFLGLAWFCGYYLIEGISKLIEILSSEQVISGIVSLCQDALHELQKLVQFLNIEIVNNEVAGLIGDVAKKIITVLSNFSLSIALQVPELLMASLIGCVAVFYMLCDYDKIASTITNALPQRLNLLINVFNKQVLSSFVKMLFSYVILSAICFVEMLVGLFILGVNDAGLIALIIAICDVLPVIGSGAILIPWGIVSLLMGSPVVGIGVIVLWGIIVIIRQIIEPKIVGAQIGLHPLVTVSSLYVGLQLMGGVGLVIAPLYIITYQKFQNAVRIERSQRIDGNDSSETQNSNECFSIKDQTNANCSTIE